MNNRIITILFLILFACQYPVQAQNNKEKAEIEKLMQKYYKIYIKGNWPELVNHLYPKVFEVYSKETLKKDLAKKKPENPMTETHYDSLWTLSITQKLIHKKISYYLITYNSVLTISVKKRDVNGECDLNITKMLKGVYDKQYGAGNVIFNKPECTFTVTGHNEVIVIKDRHFKGLKLIEKKPETSNLLSTILPQEVYQHLFPAKEKTD